MPFGLDSAVHQVRGGVGAAILSDYGLIRLSGPDAASYLHAQTTHDVNALPTGMGQASALLDRKAHMQAMFSLHHLEGAFWLLLETTQIAEVLSRLEQYHFTENVVFEDMSSAITLITLQGPLSWKLLQRIFPESPQSPEEYAIWRLPKGIMAMQRSLTGEDGVILAVPTAQAAAFQARLAQDGESVGMVSITPEVREVLRIEAGIPRFGVDVTAETLLPETGLERVAVSYSKGCYLGQEVVARVKTYGSVQKALVGLVFEAGSDLPPFDASCFMGETLMGTIKSRSWSPTLQAPIAMAYVARDYRVPNTVLTLTIAGKPLTATVVMLPFYTPMAATERAQANYDIALREFAHDREAAAITLLHEAIALDPAFADAYEALGVILARQDAYDEAIVLMHKLAELQPDTVMAHTNLSVFYMKKGMKEEAEQEKAIATTLSFKKALATSQQVKTEAEEHHRQEEALAEKIRMFQEVLELDPDDTLATYGLGNAYTDLHRFEEAIPLLQKAVTLDPKYTVAYVALGKAYEGAGDRDRARQAYQAGIEVAAKRGDLMPLQDMQRRLSSLA